MRWYIMMNRHRMVSSPTMPNVNYREVLPVPDHWTMLPIQFGRLSYDMVRLEFVGTEAIVLGQCDDKFVLFVNKNLQYGGSWQFVRFAKPVEIHCVLHREKPCSFS